MTDFTLFAILGAVAYVAVIALGLLIGYWVLRLAVRHGSLDARRRWRDEEALSLTRTD